MAKSAPIVVTAGNSRALAWSYFNPQGNPDSVAGMTFQFAVFDAQGNRVFVKSSSDISQISVTDVNNGLGKIYLLPADTMGKSGAYTCEFKCADSQGGATTLWQSKFTITAALL